MSEKRKTKKPVSPATIIMAGIIVALVIGISLLLSHTISVDINDEQIKINGIYGTEINLQDIQEIKILDNIPLFGIKINGIGLGFMNIGRFTYEGIGPVLVFETKKGKGMY